MIFNRILLFFSVIFIITACSGSVDTSNFTPEEYFNYALGLYNDGDYEQAVIEFQNIGLQFPGSIFNDDAAYYLAMTYFQRKQYLLSAYEFSKLIRNYSTSPFVPDAQFMLAEALGVGFRGRLLAIRESWFKAALDGKEGLSLVYRAYEADPNNVDVQLGFGIYHYYAEVIPAKYPAVKPFMIFFPKGDKEKGLEELEKVAWGGRYARIESRYFLMTLNFQFEENMNETRRWGKILLNDFPNNPNFQKYYGLSFVKENNYPEAVKTFRDIYNKCSQNRAGYNKRYKREASYYIAMDYKIRGVVDSSAYFFEISEKLSRELDGKTESGFLINTVLYLGMLYDELGMRDKAIKYYKEVLRLRERNNSHSLAEQYLKVPYRR